MPIELDHTWRIGIQADILIEEATLPSGLPGGE
jgi:hypothetical protein